MPIQLNADDRMGGSISLPPIEVVGHPQIAAAMSAYTEASEGARQASRDAVHAEQTLRQEAVRLDADLLADALERGAEDPGQPNTERADREIANAKRRVEASRIVVGRRLTALQEALQEHGDAWISDIAASHDEAGRAWHAALDTLTGAYEALAAAESLRMFTEHGRYWAPGTLTAYVGRLPEVGIDGAIAVLREVATVETPAVEVVEVQAEAEAEVEVEEVA